jgi:hypothetical protein
MDLHKFLEDHMHDVLAEAYEAIHRSHLKNYEKSGADQVHQRLKALYVLTARAVKDRNLAPMISHTETIGRERFTAGFDLWEVQTAFNVLEEIIWTRIIHDLKPEEFGEALGLISTILGTGKDTLARIYVALASKQKAPTMNLKSLFTGTEREQ